MSTKSSMKSLKVWSLYKSHLGPHQRRILQLLAEKPGMTEREIATIVHGRPISTKDFEYVAISRSLRGLLKRGLLVRSSAEVRWSLKPAKRGRAKKTPSFG